MYMLEILASKFPGLIGVYHIIHSSKLQFLVSAFSAICLMLVTYRYRVLVLK